MIGKAGHLPGSSLIGPALVLVGRGDLILAADGSHRSSKHCAVPRQKLRGFSSLPVAVLWIIQSVRLSCALFWRIHAKSCPISSMEQVRAHLRATQQT